MPLWAAGCCRLLHPFQQHDSCARVTRGNGRHSARSTATQNHHIHLLIPTPISHCRHIRSFSFVLRILSGSFMDSSKNKQRDRGGSLGVGGHRSGKLHRLATVLVRTVRFFPTLRSAAQACRPPRGTDPLPATGEAAPRSPCMRSGVATNFQLALAIFWKKPSRSTSSTILSSRNRADSKSALPPPVCC